MYNVAATICPLVGKQVGYSSSVGQCGALGSYWLSVLTDKAYQFAYGMSGINAQWVPGSDCETVWNVFTQTDWVAIGFEKIDNPSFSQLKAGDIFFISARDGLSTGHVGIVASVANGNVTTYEQNIDGIMYVQELPDRNSWSIYGGFSGVVRKKEEKPPTSDDSNSIEINNEEEEDMIFYKVVEGKAKGTIAIKQGNKFIPVKRSKDPKKPTAIEMVYDKEVEIRKKAKTLVYQEINSAQYDAYRTIFK